MDKERAGERGERVRERRGGVRIVKTPDKVYCAHVPKQYQGKWLGSVC